MIVVSTVLALPLVAWGPGMEAAQARGFGVHAVRVVSKALLLKKLAEGRPDFQHSYRDLLDPLCHWKIQVNQGKRAFREAM